MKCAVVSEVAPSILPLTIMLILYPYTFPPLHTLFSLIPSDHEITHQWSGNPHSWDSIYQHQRKPQRLLVKLLTNKFNTKAEGKIVYSTFVRMWQNSKFTSLFFYVSEKFTHHVIYFITKSFIFYVKVKIYTTSLFTDGPDAVCDLHTWPYCVTFWTI